MKDDGIGIIVGNLLKKKSLGLDIQICETDVYYTQDIINASDNIMIIDAVDVGIGPGDTIQIPFEEINYKLFSQHDFTYDLHNKTGLLYGIQVKEIFLELGISSELRKGLKKYMDEVSKLI
jgi:hydrogenase maturation protease